MATLHILSHSPFGDVRLASCLRLLGPHDGLLLCGDAVNALRAGTSQRATLETLPAGVELFALAEDLAARGLADGPARLTLVDYPGFVDLCCRFERSNGWT